MMRWRSSSLSSIISKMPMRPVYPDAPQCSHHAHVGEAGDGAGRIVSVQGGKNQVTRERGANGDIRRFAVANFADHDYVRVLAHDMAQAGGEGQPDLRIHMDLVDAIHLVFDGVFDSDDFLVRNIDALEGRIERGGLAAASR